MSFWANLFTGAGQTAVQTGVQEAGSEVAQTALQSTVAETAVAGAGQFDWGKLLNAKNLGGAVKLGASISGAIDAHKLSKQSRKIAGNNESRNQQAWEQQLADKKRRQNLHF